VPITDKIASGVTYLPDISQLRIIIGEDDAATAIFDLLARHNINVDCLNVHPGEVLFTVEEADLDKAEELLRAADYSALTVKRECAKVSVVGAGMRGVPGVMATFVRAFAQAGIAILQTVDSNITISAVVDRDRLTDALAELHEVFGLAKNHTRGE
jgi:aspartate kinase